MKSIYTFYGVPVTYIVTTFTNFSLIMEKLRGLLSFVKTNYWIAMIALVGVVALVDYSRAGIGSFGAIYYGIWTLALAIPAIIGKRQATVSLFFMLPLVNSVYHFVTSYGADEDSGLAFFWYCVVLSLLFVCWLFQQPSAVADALEHTRRSLTRNESAAARGFYFFTCVILWVLTVFIAVFYIREFGFEFFSSGNSYKNQNVLYFWFIPSLIVTTIVTGWTLAFLKIITEIVFTPVYLIGLGIDYRSGEITGKEAMDELSNVLVRKYHFYRGVFLPTRMEDTTPDDGDNNNDSDLSDKPAEEAILKITKEALS